MPHKRAKAVGKLLFFDNKTAPRSIDRFGFMRVREIFYKRRSVLILYCQDGTWWIMILLLMLKCDKSHPFAGAFWLIHIYRGMISVFINGMALAVGAWFITFRLTVVRYVNDNNTVNLLYSKPKSVRNLLTDLALNPNRSLDRICLDL